MPIPLGTNPLTKRLILIVADGLRTSNILDHEMRNTPFIKHILQNEGAYAISFTRVPTETRTCHVVLLAGFYEDVASITK
ncbi:unnamed protein product, partial [Protopolystoma xenopodis]